MASIKISTGLKVYDIEDEHGNVRGQVSFNPADMGFYERARNFYDEMQTLIDSIENDESLQEADKVIEADKRMKERLNELFDDPNASAVVFGNQNCFNTLNGITFVERFLNAFMPIIKDEFAKEKKKSDKRIEKYMKVIK
nr:MAG TPA: hypothetical protein [Caudoviricetes sp.]